MRVYRVRIKPNSLIGKFAYLEINQNTNSKLPSDNIQIEFDIQQLEDLHFNSALINLYNVNKYWHNENAANRLINAEVIIWAGEKATPISKHAGMLNTAYIASGNSSIAINNSMILYKAPIYRGFVINAYPNMSGRDTILQLNCSIFPLLAEDAKVKPNYALAEEQKQGIGIQTLSIPKGVNWRPFVVLFANTLLTKLKAMPYVAVIQGLKSKGSKTLNDTAINDAEIASMDELERLVKNTWHEKFTPHIVSGSNQIIYIGDNPKQGLSMIPDEELISQPQMIDPATITVTVPLTNRFRIGQYIQLALKSFVSYQQVNATLGDVGNLFLGTDTARKMFAGTFVIKEIWHKGQSRSSSADAWATTLKMVNNKAEGISSVLSFL